MNYPLLKDWLSAIKTDIPIFSVQQLSKYIKDGIYKINDISIPEILLSTDLKFLNSILINLGFNLSGLDFENSLTLITWYLYYDVSILISYKKRYWVSTATNAQIISKLGSGWHGTSNRASLIFSAYTGFLAPESKDLTETTRYAQILESDKIPILYKYLYNVGNVIPPIRQIASQKKHPLEYVFKYDDVQLYDWCIQLQVLPFKFIKLNNDLNIDLVYENLEVEEWDQFKLILYSQIKKYEYIDESDSIEHCSDLALVQRFKPPSVENRTALLNLIKTPHWRSYDTFYEDLKTGIHIIEREPRLHSADNPIIAFGTLNAYNFWNIDELILSFENNINFKYPDAPTAFTITQIKQLTNFLSQHNISEALQLLISTKLQVHKGITQKLEYLKSLYSQFTDKIIINHLLLDLFYLGLYARFWKGKDHDYPYNWEDLDTTLEFHNCREDNVNIILERIFGITDPATIYFLELIPRIQCDWITKIPEFGAEGILQICKTTYSNDFCLSHFSNIILESAYYLIVIVLKCDLSKLLLADGCKYEFEAEKMRESLHRDPTLKLSKVEI